MKRASQFLNHLQFVAGIHPSIDRSVEMARVFVVAVLALSVAVAVAGRVLEEGEAYYGLEAAAAAPGLQLRLRRRTLHHQAAAAAEEDTAGAAAPAPSSTRSGSCSGGPTTPWPAAAAGRTSGRTTAPAAWRGSR